MRSALGSAYLAPGAPPVPQERAWVLEFLRNNPRLRVVIGKALDRNARVQPLPAALEVYRKKVVLHYAANKRCATGSTTSDWKRTSSD